MVKEVKEVGGYAESGSCENAGLASILVGDPTRCGLDKNHSLMTKQKQRVGGKLQTSVEHLPCPPPRHGSEDEPVSAPSRQSLRSRIEVRTRQVAQHGPPPSTPLALRSLSRGATPYLSAGGGVWSRFGLPYATNPVAGVQDSGS